MKREHFLRTIAALAGGLTVVSCSNDLISELVDVQQPLGDLSIDDAKKWFNEQYLPNISATAKVDAGKTHKRKAAWDRAQKPKNSQNKEYVWVPIDYEDSNRPGVVLYDDQTLYKKDLYKYYLEPVIEGLIVVNQGDEKKAFLAQVSFDQLSLANDGYILKRQNFTGTLLKCDWDDHIINGITYEKGQPQKTFINEIDEKESGVSNGRVQNCIYTFIASNNTWYVNSSNELVIVVHNNWSVTCDGSGAGGNGGFGGFGGGSGGSTPGGNNGDGSYYDPLVNSGAGTATFPDPQIYNFNILAALQTHDADRVKASVNLQGGALALGLATDVLGWNYATASALARTIGGNLETFSPLAYSAATKVGIAGIVVGGVQLGMGIAENGWQWDQEGWTLGQIACGVAGTFLITAGSPWIVVIGGISIGITVYTQSQNPQSGN